MTFILTRNYRTLAHLLSIIQLCRWHSQAVGGQILEDFLESPEFDPAAAELVSVEPTILH